MSTVQIPRAAVGYSQVGGNGQVVESAGFLTAAQLGISLPFTLPSGLNNRPQTNVLVVPGFDAWMMLFSVSATQGGVLIAYWYLDPLNRPGFSNGVLPLNGPIFETIYDGAVGSNIVVTFGHQGTAGDLNLGDVNMLTGFSFIRTGVPSNGVLTDLKLWTGVR